MSAPYCEQKFGPEFCGQDVHGWFGLSYSSYAVLTRSLMQEMPAEWQHRFVNLMGELHVMAGTWLDLRGLAAPATGPFVGRITHEMGGGRHWTRTSDLLHVKQDRERSRAQRSVAGTTTDRLAQPEGWTLAGRP